MARKQQPRTWSTYYVKKGNKIVDGGITQNLDRRTCERERLGASQDGLLALAVVGAG